MVIGTRMSLAWRSLLVEVVWIVHDVAEMKTHVVYKVTAFGLLCRTVAVGKRSSSADARYFVRVDQSGALDLFFAVEDIQNWRVIALRALPPSERPHFLPADFIGIVHGTVDNPKKPLTVFYLKGLITNFGLSFAGNLAHRDRSPGRVARGAGALDLVQRTGGHAMPLGLDAVECWRYCLGPGDALDG